MKLPAFVSDPWIRHKVRLHEVDTERFRVRLARTAQEYQDAFRLVHVGYVFQGIEPLRELDLRITEQHVLSEATVLVAYEGEQIVGTISITKDSPAGLPLDKDYPEALAKLRNAGAQIAEIGSLAVVRRCWHSSLMPLLGMAAARVAFRVYGSTHQVIGIHPKATPFYRALWDFHPLGPARRHSELEAPVIGLAAERESLRSHATRFYRRPMTVEKTLPVDYVFDARIPRNLYLPEDIPAHEWPRFKMSRGVFRELFIERANRLSSLSVRTVDHLRTQRSEQTVGMKSESVRVTESERVSE
jgi:hypothetical protein